MIRVFFCQIIFLRTTCLTNYRYNVTIHQVAVQWALEARVRLCLPLGTKKVNKEAPTCPVIHHQGSKNNKFFRN